MFTLALRRVLGAVHFIVALKKSDVHCHAAFYYNTACEIIPERIVKVCDLSSAFLESLFSLIFQIAASQSAFSTH